MLCAEVKAQVCKQTQKADLQQTYAKQDKARQNKQIAATFCKTIS